tara:strand:+ start:6561 stop:9398 length:2838 start_codon:yes stop_codon:yes gene_type:complete
MSNIDKLLYIDGIGEITQNLNIGGNLNVTENLFTKKLGIGTSNIDIGSVFHITGDTTVQGNIIPTSNNLYDLGSSSNTFRHVYVGPGSLYVNGKQVITDHSDTITISTTQDQNLSLKTTGTGDLELNAGGVIQFKKNILISEGQKIKYTGSTLGIDGSLTTDTSLTSGTTITAGTSFIIGSVDINETDLDKIDNITNGIGVANKALVLDLNKDITGIRNLNIDGNLIISGATTTIDSTTISIRDGLFKYAKDNVADIIDFGWYGQYVDTNGINRYSGMFRDSTDNKIHLFTNTQIEPTITVDLLGTDYNKADLVCNNIQIEDLTTDGVTLTSNELIHLSGSSSNIQTQLNTLSSNIGNKQDTLTFGKSDGNALKSEQSLLEDDILLMGTDHVKGRTFNGLKSDLLLNNVENTALSTWSGSSYITSLGTISNFVMTGTFTADGGTGTNGQVLKSTGSGIEWANESGGGGSSVWSQSGSTITTTNDIDIRSRIRFKGSNGNNYGFEIGQFEAGGINGISLEGHTGGKLITNTHGTVLDWRTDRVKMYKPLYMNSTTATGEDRPIYLHYNTDFYIKYQNSNLANVVEIKGFEGVHLGDTRYGNMRLKVQTDRVEVDGKLRIMNGTSETASITNAGAATFTSLNVSGTTTINGYVTNSTFNGTLSNYVSYSTFNGALNNYVTYSDLNGTLSNYAYSNHSHSGSGGGSSVWSTNPWVTSKIYYSGGNVGIGLMSPIAGLHVKGGGLEANRIQIESTDSNNPVLQFFKQSSGCWFYYDGANLRHSHTFAYDSDDRIKENERLILNSINTILKLRPQTYIKKLGIMSINEINNNTETIFEAGLIAQEIYYEAPELRHLVSVPSDAILIDDNKYRNFTDIKNDPDYNNWGNNIASVNYTGLIPYLIKGIQEQQEEINTLKQENIELKQENIELKSIIDKLKTANSFEEFKNLL